jgi:signal transduction histidine kinase
VKDEFLGLVSHELKTPITVIRGNAEVLDTRGSQIDDVSRAIAVRDIRRESERLSRMVDDLLSLSRLGLLQLEKEPLLVRRVVDRIVAEHRRYDQGRPMPVRGDAPPALGAAVAVEHILHNLLTNAERYSPQYTPIEVDLRHVGQEVEVAVRDHGSGITPQDAEKVFAPFYRSAAGERVAGGIGIGLTVCKRLVEAQGGRIWAAPASGGGTEVTFTLPLAADDGLSQAR